MLGICVHAAPCLTQASICLSVVLAYDIILDSDLRSAYSLPDTTIAAQKMAVRIYALTGEQHDRAHRACIILFGTTLSNMAIHSSQTG